MPGTFFLPFVKKPFFRESFCRIKIFPGKKGFLAGMVKKVPGTFFAYLYSSHNVFPVRKMLYRFMPHNNQNNAGGWRARAWVKTCCGLSAAGDQKMIQPAGLSFKGGVYD